MRIMKVPRVVVGECIVWRVHVTLAKKKRAKHLDSVVMVIGGDAQVKVRVVELFLVDLRFIS